MFGKRKGKKAKRASDSNRPGVHEPENTPWGNTRPAAPRFQRYEGILQARPSPLTAAYIILAVMAMHANTFAATGSRLPERHADLPFILPPASVIAPLVIHEAAARTRPGDAIGTRRSMTRATWTLISLREVRFLWIGRKT